MKLNRMTLSLLACSLVLLFLNNCNSNTTYYEDDVYVEQYVFYDKKTKKPISGLLIRKDKSGKVKSKWTYKNGLVDGNTENFFVSGKLQAKGQYKNGEKHGETIIYNNDGKIYEVSNYNNGKMDGTYVVNFPSGNPREKSQYKNGEKESETTYAYYKTGVLRRESFFVNNHLRSRKRFNDNGKVKDELNITSDNQINKKEYSPLGVINKETVLIDNKLYVLRHFSFEGKLDFEDYCTKDESKLRKKYSPSGELASEEVLPKSKSFFSQMNISCNKHIPTGAL